MVNPLKFAARALVAAPFVTGGLNQLKGYEKLGPMVDAAKQEYGVDVPVSGAQLARLNGAGMLAAGAAMTLGLLPRTSAVALTGLLAPTTVVGHAFWKVDDPGKRMGEQTAFVANCAMAGGLLLVALDRKH